MRRFLAPGMGAVQPKKKDVCSMSLLHLPPFIYSHWRERYYDGVNFRVVRVKGYLCVECRERIVKNDR